MAVGQNSKLQRGCSSKSKTGKRMREGQGNNQERTEGGKKDEEREKDKKAILEREG